MDRQSGDQGSNGRVTLAVLGRDMERLMDAFAKHDDLQRDQFNKLWRRSNEDHDRLIRHEEKVTGLEDDMGRIKNDMTLVRNEGRIWNGLNSLAAAVAGVLGVQIK